MKKFISIISVVLLVALMACMFTGCGSKEPEEPAIPACKEGMEHDWTITVFRKATCLETGLEKHVCKNCEYTEHKSVAALGHKFETDDAGITICEHCGLIEHPFQDTTEPAGDVIIVE